MLKERLSVAHEVVRHLADAERTNDLAIMATARLAIVVLEGRLKLNAAAQVGQEAFDAIASTFEQQSSSRRQLVAAHMALAETKRLVGLGAVNFGGAGDKEVPDQKNALELVGGTAT